MLEVIKKFMKHTGQRLSESVSEATGRRRVRVCQFSLDGDTTASCCTASCTLETTPLFSTLSYTFRTLQPRLAVVAAPAAAPAPTARGPPAPATTARRQRADLVNAAPGGGATAR